MWFKLAKADWSGEGNNLGTMDSLMNAWSVTYSISGGLTKLNAPAFVTKGSTLTATFTLAEGATITGTPSSTSGTVSTPSVSGTTVTITVTGISKNCTITIAATGGSVEPETPVNPPSEPEVPDTPTGSTVFDFDFINYKLTDYVDQGIFTVPDTSTIDTIIYDTSKGANLNNNLPYGLTLTNPIDASRAWTLEFTATMVTPTALVGNRRAFITGGSDLAPFVVINFSDSTVNSQGFQISNGAHKWVGTGKLTCDQEVTYKIVHDGASNIAVYQNGIEFGTTTCDFTGKTFGTILGVIKGKSSAYIWQDVESGKKSYLKKLKFSYN